MDNSPLKSVEEFCRNNGISRVTLWNLEKQGKGPAFMRIGRRKLITATAEAAWREAHQDQQAKAA